MTTARAQEERKKYIVIGVFTVLLLFVGYRIYDAFFSGTTSAPPPPVIVEAPQTAGGGRGVMAAPGNVAASSATRVGTTSGQLDPTLHEEAMLVTEGLVYSGTGRNIFAAAGEQAPPPEVKPIPVAIASVRRDPPPPVVQQPVTCPPTCPPINLKFFGTSTSSAGVRKAFLLQGDDVYLASVGDVVQRKYRVVSIAANSIVVEDMPNTNSQTLPLVLN